MKELEPVTFVHDIATPRFFMSGPTKVIFRSVTPWIGIAPPVKSPIGQLAGPWTLMSSNTKFENGVAREAFLLSHAKPHLTNCRAHSR